VFHNRSAHAKGCGLTGEHTKSILEPWATAPVHYTGGAGALAIDTCKANTGSKIQCKERPVGPLQALNYCAFVLRGNGLWLVPWPKPRRYIRELAAAGQEDAPRWLAGPKAPQYYRRHIAFPEWPNESPFHMLQKLKNEWVAMPIARDPPSLLFFRKKLLISK